MPTPRGEHGAIILGDKIYVIGGRERPGFKTDVVEVYDLKSKQWSTGSSFTSRVRSFWVISK